MPGMVLAIEPMLTQGSYEGRTLDDDWTIVTVDQGLAVHVEHTVAITDGDPEILTLP
jgi:methionyl aminopeptidase